MSDKGNFGGSCWKGVDEERYFVDGERPTPLVFTFVRQIT